MTLATLEFTLHPDDVQRLAKLPGLTRVGRAAPVTTLWHDTPDGALAARSLSLSEQRGRWRLEALGPEPARPWPPGTPPPLLAEGPGPTSLHHGLPSGLVPVAALRGRRIELLQPIALAAAIPGSTAPDPANPVEDMPDLPVPDPLRLTVWDGRLRGVVAEQAACRVVLCGEPDRVRVLALELADAVRLEVPRAGLAAAAIAIAHGEASAPRHDGPPAITPDLKLTDSIALLIGQLLDTMLHWCAGAAAGATPIPVHQMRVATRRLRSALAIFKHVAACPAVSPLGPGLRDAATRLGAARDWDVFLGGTAERIAAAFPDDRRVRSLLTAARRRRLAAYAELRAYLNSANFRRLEVSIACAASLRPWDYAGTPDPRLQLDTAPFASVALDHQMRRTRRAARGLPELPVEAMHELRKDCKRLRYTAEFFQPLFPEKPARRFVKALAALQEELGAFNDGAAVAGLMAHLGRAERSYAAGLVEGFIAAGTTRSRARIGEAWKAFRKVPAFWA